MEKKRTQAPWLVSVTLMMLMLVTPFGHAAIDGISGTHFTLTARQDFITTADGNSLTIWGYGNGARAQYPGPTFIVNEGDTVTVELTSAIAKAGTGHVPVSIVFPGMEGVTASGGAEGLLTRESTGPEDTVTYTFTANRPGTFLYHSGTQPELQVEMGLAGAIVVRPRLGAGYAYNDASTRFDHEYLFLLTEMDERIHRAVATGNLGVDTRDYFSVYWFINGRTAPDTVSDAGVPWLPTQPYNSLPRTRPGETVLMRVVAAGREMHPFHTHGNNALIIARDGRPLSSSPGSGTDLAYSDYTIAAVPGQTYDALFSWTGKGLGWDVYGHATGDGSQCVDTVNNRTGAGSPDGFDDTTWEYCADHAKPFPVVLPEYQDLVFGAWYSGSPFLGAMGNLPPGEGGLNLYGGLFYMWHSHTEKELTNFDIFPGGMMTMLIVEPPGTPIP
ncbi:MAG: multicopper oxidase domain-containing protein [Gammaproteobacteria bacterium]|nr:multicopper oxidase domain-containing protein [Gammaproteobacteria bacterium]